MYLWMYCVCVYRRTCCGICMWRSENNLLESVLSFYTMWVWRIELRLSGLVARTLTPWKKCCVEPRTLHKLGWRSHAELEPTPQWLLRLPWGNPASPQHGHEEGGHSLPLRLNQTIHTTVDSYINEGSVCAFITRKLEGVSIKSVGNLQSSLQSRHC